MAGFVNRNPFGPLREAGGSGACTRHVQQMHNMQINGIGRAHRTAGVELHIERVIVRREKECRRNGDVELTVIEGSWSGDGNGLGSSGRRNGGLPIQANHRRSSTGKEAQTENPQFRLLSHAYSLRHAWLFGVCKAARCRRLGRKGCTQRRLNDRHAVSRHGIGQLQILDVSLLESAPRIQVHIGQRIASRVGHQNIFGFGIVHHRSEHLHRRGLPRGRVGARSLLPRTDRGNDPEGEIREAARRRSSRIDERNLVPGKIGLGIVARIVSHHHVCERIEGNRPDPALGSPGGSWSACTAASR